MVDNKIALNITIITFYFCLTSLSFQSSSKEFPKKIAVGLITIVETDL